MQIQGKIKKILEEEELFWNLDNKKVKALSFTLDKKIVNRISVTLIEFLKYFKFLKKSINNFSFTLELVIKKNLKYSEGYNIDFFA